MQVNFLNKEEFFNLAYQETERFLEIIEAPEAIVVKNLYSIEDILKIREKAFQEGLVTEPSWNPCYDGVPDYHRLHDNYPNSYVKGKFHAFYYHGFYRHNDQLFNAFEEIFHLKNYLIGHDKNDYIRNIPSQGQIARVNIHNYPKGGGYQAEHIDPVSKFALIQTLVVASKKGEDYMEGGLYVQESQGSERIYLDSHTDIGDLMVISPGICHGVDSIDPVSGL